MDIISSFIITPLKAIFELLYSFSLSVTHGYGSALLILSLITSLLIYPLGTWINKYVNYEKKIQAILNPQIISINNKYKGKEKNSALSRLYKRYSYNPFYSMRLSFNILIQLPLLFGAYCFLESYTKLEKVSFLFIKDLASADGLLFGLNLLPFVMTIVNVSVAFLTPGSSKKDKIQATVIAFFFLVILYSAPSALLIYWTCNNVISFFKVLFTRNRIKINSLVNKIVSRLVRNAIKDFYDQSWKLLILLSSIAPACLLWFKNIELFGIESICKSIFVLVILSLIFILVFGIFKKFENVVRSTPYKVIFISIIILSSILLFYGASKGIFQTEKKYLVILCPITLLLFLIGRIRLLNFVLLIQTVVIVMTGIISHSYSEYSLAKDIESHQIETSLSLKNTPNIYYILCESMNSLDIANKVYGLPQKEIDEFKEFMKERNFEIPNEIFSNGYATLNTMYYLSVMDTSPTKSVGNLDFSINARRVISGNNNNNLLKILKHNNYHVSHLLQGNKYFYNHKGYLVDYSDISPLVYDAKLDPLMYLHGIMRKIEEKYLYKKIYYSRDTKKKIKTDPIEAITWYFEQDFKSPKYVFQRMAYTDHTPSEGYTYKNAKEWIDSKLYLNAYRKQIDSIKIETDIILKNDPNAIIIYLGDHGAWLYRAYPYDKKSLNKILREANITEKEFMEDKFKVFAAVRLPKNISIGENFSSVNIFSKIFNKIGTTDGKVFPIAENNSYFMNKMVIKNSNFINFE